MSSMKKFVVVDGNAILHRSYHALPKTLKAPSGEVTNAVFGFTSILLGILEHEKPESLAVAFDMKGPTFRHAEFKEYKETRAKTDDELIAQFPLAQDLLRALNVPIFEKEGWEADDYLAMIATDLEKNHSDYELVIVTSDKDAFQLVSERVTVVTPITGYTKVKRYTPEAVKEKMGVWPKQVPDFKGLSGDASDNIHGVPGVGPKTAADLLEKFGTLEGIYEHLDKVESARVRELLREHEETARLSKRVATLLHDGEGFHLDLKKCAVHDLSMEKARVLFTALAFRSLLVRLEKLNGDWDKRRKEEKQVSMF